MDIMDYALYIKAFFYLVPEFERSSSGQKEENIKICTFFRALDSLYETFDIVLKENDLKFYPEMP
jgi:hypothetical protein